MSNIQQRTRVSPTCFHSAVHSPVTGCSLERSALQSALLGKKRFILPLPILQRNQVFEVGLKRGKHLVAVLPDLFEFSYADILSDWSSLSKLWFTIGFPRVKASISCDGFTRDPTACFYTGDYEGYRYGQRNEPERIDLFRFGTFGRSNLKSKENWKEFSVSACNKLLRCSHVHYAAFPLPSPLTVYHTLTYHIKSSRWEESFEEVEYLLDNYLRQEKFHVFL